MINRYVFSLVWLLLFPFICVSQKTPFKFGKVDESLVKSTVHPLDSAADAIVLADYGITSFKYDNQRGFYFIFEHTKRIKILTKDGLDHANISVPYYHKGSIREKVTNIKGNSYNYVNGSVKKTKLTKSSVFDEKTNDNWNLIKISMPDVKKGTVVEVSYMLTSPYIWNLTTWKFQDEIPTVYSEYNIAIPEYFDYQLLQSGYHPFVTNKQTKEPGSITIQTKSREGGNSSFSTTKTNYSNQSLNFVNNTYRWIAKDVPAFVVEPYVSSPFDYMSKVEFELRGTKYPNSKYKAYMGSWQSLNTSFLRHSRFGVAYRQTGYMNKELATLATLESSQEKIAGLVRLIQNQVAWDGRNTVYSTASLREAWINKKGGSADLNLMVVAGLKELGFNADPVLVSTRSHGLVRDQYAISQQFNTVVAIVEVGDKRILIDATDRFLPIGILPKRYINGKGWRVSNDSPGWVSLKAIAKWEDYYSGDFAIGDDGALSGTMQYTAKGYAGFDKHKKLKLQGKDQYVDNFRSENEKIIVENYSFNDSSSITEPFKSNYSVVINDLVVNAGSKMYFNPTLEIIQTDNPFKLEKRVYPVDFAYPIRNVYQFKFSIPKAYEVEELPQSTAFGLPENGGIFRYNLSQSGEEILLMVEFKINKAIFSQPEYKVLKEFYHQVVNKCAEQIVLKQKI